MSVHVPTLDRLAGPWTIALQNIIGLSGMGMWQPQRWQSMCLLLGTKWMIYPRQQWSMLTPSCPDPLPSWVLAHPAWTDPSQQGKGNIARTLRHHAELTLFCVSLISSVLHVEACCLIIIHLFFVFIFLFLFFILFFTHRSVISFYAQLIQLYMQHLCSALYAVIVILFLFPSIFLPLASHFVSHITTCLHLYLYRSACSYLCHFLMKATRGCRNV